MSKSKKATGARDGFVVPKDEPLRAAHARIDALLDEIAVENPLNFAMSLDITAFEAGAAMVKAPDLERSENAAAALLRSTAACREYKGGIFSEGDYTADDYRVVVERVAQAVLRTRIRFGEALLVRMVTEVADYAGSHARSYPVKSLLGQVEHFVKHEGALPASLRAPLQVIVDLVTADAARQNGKPAKILGEVAGRAKALLEPTRTTKATKPPAKTAARAKRTTK